MSYNTPPPHTAPHPRLGELRGSGTKGKRQQALLMGLDKALKIPSAAPSLRSPALPDDVKGEHGCPAANIWPPRWMFPRKQAEWNGGQSRGRGGGGGFLKSHSLSQRTRLECVDRKKLVWIGLFWGKGWSLEWGRRLVWSREEKVQGCPQDFQVAGFSERIPSLLEGQGNILRTLVGTA